MKIFNVSIQVTIRHIADISDQDPDPPAAPPKFSDDPLDKAKEMLESYADRLGLPKRHTGAGVVFVPPAFGYSESDATSSTENIRIQAETFEELQAILARFHAVAKDLPAVPESLLRHAGPA